MIDSKMLHEELQLLKERGLLAWLRYDSVLENIKSDKTNLAFHFAACFLLVIISRISIAIYAKKFKASKKTSGKFNLNWFQIGIGFYLAKTQGWKNVSFRIYYIFFCLAYLGLFLMIIGELLILLDFSKVYISAVIFLRTFFLISIDFTFAMVLLKRIAETISKNS